MLMEIQVRGGGGLKNDPIRRGGGGVDFFWNNPTPFSNVNLSKSNRPLILKIFQTKMTQKS